MLISRFFIVGLVMTFCSALSFAEGNVSYALHKSANPSADEQNAYKRITAVMDSAVKLYNTYSNLTKFINVYYAPWVPTAEASSNGDLRWCPRPCTRWRTHLVLEPRRNMRQPA